MHRVLRQLAVLQISIGAGKHKPFIERINFLQLILFLRRFRRCQIDKQHAVYTPIVYSFLAFIIRLLGCEVNKTLAIPAKSA